MAETEDEYTHMTNRVSGYSSKESLELRFSVGPGGYQEIANGQ